MKEKPKPMDYLEAIEGKLRYQILMRNEKDPQQKANYKRLYRKCKNILIWAKEGK